MASNEITSSLRDVARNITEQIRFHENELKNLRKLQAALDPMLGSSRPSGTPVVRGRRVMGLQKAIMDEVTRRQKESHTTISFTWVTLDNWLGSGKWTNSAYSGALTSLVEKGKLEQVGMTEPLAAKGSSVRKPQRLFRVITETK